MIYLAMSVGIWFFFPAPGRFLTILSGASVGNLLCLALAWLQACSSSGVGPRLSIYGIFSRVPHGLDHEYPSPTNRLAPPTHFASGD